MTTPNQTYAQAIVGSSSSTETDNLRTSLPSIPRGNWTPETAKRIEDAITNIYTDLNNLKTKIEAIVAQL